MPEPTPDQVQWFTFTSRGLLALDALLGLAILRGRWRQSQALERPRPTPPTRTP